LLNRVLVCLAFSTCCFLNTWIELAEGQVPYFAKYDPLRVTIPVVLCWQALIFAALFLGWGLLRRMPYLLLALSVVPLGFTSLALLRVLPFDLVPLVRQPWFWPVALVLLTAAAVFILRRPQWVSRVYLYLCPVLALVVLRAVSAVALYGAAGLFADGPAAARLTQPHKNIRVVWIIFDELSQAIAFDRRPAGLALPNLDRLRAESLSATSAHAPAGATKESLPSLTLGQEIRIAEPAGPHSLMLYKPGQTEGFEWNSVPNVFDRARELGFNTALTGWFHPYGRLLNRSLTACYWTAGWLLSGTEEPTQEPSLPEAMLHRARCQLAAFPLLGHLPGFFPREYQRQETAARFQYLLRKSRDLAADSSIGLTLLHLPTPHPPAIYNRASGQFSNRGPNGYLDSVALADVTLGQLRQSVTAAGLDSSTAIIVSADHGWRMLWRGGPDWTAEEEAASKDLDTSGVPFLVKLPGDSRSIVYDRPLNTVVTGELILAILRGNITGNEQAAEWLRVR